MKYDFLWFTILIYIKGYSEVVNRRMIENIMAKWKRTKGQTTIYKTLHRKLNLAHRQPVDELMCSGRVSCFCSTCANRRVTLVSNSVISHKRGKDREMLTTNGTYMWLFVTQILHSGSVIHGGDRKTFEVMTSTLPIGTLGSIQSL